MTLQGHELRPLGRPAAIPIALSRHLVLNREYFIFCLICIQISALNYLETRSIAWLYRQSDEHILSSFQCKEWISCPLEVRRSQLRSRLILGSKEFTETTYKQLRQE
jgi:hypothetical protein